MRKVFGIGLTLIGMLLGTAIYAHGHCGHHGGYYGGYHHYYHHPEDDYCLNCGNHQTDYHPCGGNCKNYTPNGYYRQNPNGWNPNRYNPPR